MAFAMGISIEDFKHLTPYKLECCLKGNRMNRQMRDEEMWLWFGSYGVSAVTKAIDQCFSGTKAKASFVKEPLFAKLIENEQLTEEEKYERELQKALLAEEQWIMAGQRKGLPETVIL